MIRRSIAVFAIAAAGLSAASPLLLARQRNQTRPNDPGMPTAARTYVLNSGADEAIPVVLHGGTDVQPVAVMSVPPVTLAANATVTSRTGRQAWEYQVVTAPLGQDPSPALNAAGQDGWEAVGISTGSGMIQVVLKRPR